MGLGAAFQIKHMLRQLGRVVALEPWVSQSPEGYRKKPGRGALNDGQFRTVSSDHHCIQQKVLTYCSFSFLLMIQDSGGESH